MKPRWSARSRVLQLLWLFSEGIVYPACFLSDQHAFYVLFVGHSTVRSGQLVNYEILCGNDPRLSVRIQFDFLSSSDGFIIKDNPSGFSHSSISIFSLWSTTRIRGLFGDLMDGAIIALWVVSSRFSHQDEDCHHYQTDANNDQCQK